MKDSDRACGNCRFWSHLLLRKSENGVGRCLRFPPALAPHIDKPPEGELDNGSDDWAYPITEGEAWCGEHQFQGQQP